MASYAYQKGDDFYLALKVLPRAKQDAWLGKHGDRIKIAIKAPPIDNKANKYLLKFLAKYFNIKQNQITIKSGEHSCNKLVCIKSSASNNLLLQFLDL